MCLHVHAGVRLQKDLYTRASLYTGCEAWLHLYSHMVMKTANESVVESMGSKLDIHGSSSRHLQLKAISQETFIHWNGPVPHRAKAFLLEALADRFGGGPGKWHFVSRSKSSMLKSWLVSEVVDKKLLGKQSRLKFME